MQVHYTACCSDVSTVDSNLLTCNALTPQTYFTINVKLKELVHSVMKSMSFTHPYVVPNLYAFTGASQ